MRKEIKALFFIVFFYSCYIPKELPENNTHNFSNVFFGKWKDDKKGCKGVRAESYNLILDNKKQFYGRHQDTILNKLGKPDKLSDNGSWDYFVEPGIQCFKDSTVVDSKIISFVIKDSSVQDLRIIVP